MFRYLAILAACVLPLSLAQPESARPSRGGRWAGTSRVGFHGCLHYLTVSDGYGYEQRSGPPHSASAYYDGSGYAPRLRDAAHASI